MHNKCLLATATYNEKINIKNLIYQIKKQKFKNYDFLIVDDNSPDGTSLIINFIKKKKKNIKLITRKAKLGLDSAYKLIFNYALKKKYSFLITFDSDLSHRVIDIKKIYNILKKKKYDFIIGSRNIKNGRLEIDLHRKILSLFGNKIIKFILNTNLNEHTTSLRGYNLLSLKKCNFNINKVKSSGYSFFMEMVFYIYLLKLRILEVPIIFKKRVYGKSKIEKIEIFRTIYNLFRIKFFGKKIYSSFEI